MFMNEPKHLPQTTRSELLLCLFLFFIYLKLHSLVVLGASFCIQHPRCLIVIPPLLKPPLPSPPSGAPVTRNVSAAGLNRSRPRPGPRRRAASAGLLRPRDSPSFANGTSAAVSGPRTASAALIGPHGCGLQKRSAELSEQPPPNKPPLQHFSISLV